MASLMTFERGFGAGQVRRETALVAHAGGGLLVVQDLLEGVEDLGASAQGLAEGGRALGNDHELLEVEHVVGVRAAVDDVHQGHGQTRGIGAAQVLVERNVQLLRGRAGGRERNAQDGVGAGLGLVGRAVGRQHGAVEASLIEDVAPDDRRRQDLAHVVHGLEHALLLVALGIAVAQFQGFVFAGRRARGHGRQANDAGFKMNLALNRGIAARVEDLAGHELLDGAVFMVAQA
jgi:hypothetical protein